MRKSKRNQMKSTKLSDSIQKKLQLFMALVLICATIMLLVICNAYKVQQKQIWGQLAFWAEQGSVVSAMECQVGDGIYFVNVENSKEQQMNSDANKIETSIVNRRRISKMTNEENEILYRIVEAEAGGEDYLGKKMVADVVINRVQNSKFPNSVKGVVFEKTAGAYQFSPIYDGRYYKVKISQETKDAVNDALYGNDDTNGALYFISPEIANADNYMWFTSHLSLASSHGLHCFYK